MRSIYEGHIALFMCIVCPKEYPQERAFWHLRHNVPLFNKAQGKFHHSHWLKDQEILAEMKALKKEGVTYRKIAEWYGINERTIQHLRRGGLL